MSSEGRGAYVFASCLVASGFMVANAVLFAAAVSLGLPAMLGLLLLAVPAILGGLWYRSSHPLRPPGGDGSLLYGFTARLAALSETDAIVAAALTECQTLLSCRHAHLVVNSAGSATRWEISEHSGPPSVRRILTLDGPDREVLRVSGPSPAGSVRRRGGSQEDLLAAPVPMGGTDDAVLVVTGRDRPDGGFDADDVRLFEAISAHLGTALTSSRRLEQLQRETAARHHQSLHDTLTGLANRTQFSQWVARELERRPTDRHVAVLVLDLDGFKDINDTLGHHSGDLLLEQLARRLESLVTPTRSAARLGGDEFAFVLSDLGDPEEAVRVARAIATEVAAPLQVQDLSLHLRAGIGIAIAPAHGSDPVALLQRADVAMYAAKASKVVAEVYDPEMEQCTRRRLTLGTSLLRAVEEDRLEVWYQPVARSVTGAISSCEALLRWREGEELVPPAEFIPIAEQTGLIDRITWWTMGRALADLRAWRNEDICPAVAVNLSTRCLQAPDAIRRVRDLLIGSDVPAASLTLEITESLLLADPERAERLLDQLSLMGVRIAIDDFGTGYSSLSRLKRLPVHTIKIDRDFVINMHADRDDEAIVKATIEMARTLGCSVVAEGVETLEAWHQLQAFGCQQIQGFILAPPMPAHECHAWLRSRRYLVSSGGRSGPPSRAAGTAAGYP